MTTIDARTLDRGRPARKILDVRTPTEYDTARIPEAVNIPLDRLDDHAEDPRWDLERQVRLVAGGIVATDPAAARAALAGAGR